MIAALPHSTTLLCAVAGVSKSGYYAWKRAAPQRRARAADDRTLVTGIETVCKRHVGTYGYRRVTMALHDNGYTDNHKRVARVMRRYGMQA